MTYRILQAGARHVRPMAKRMRMEAAVALRDMGFDPRRGLHEAWLGSHFCQVALDDEGHPLAMWGVHGSVLSDKALVWLVLAEGAQRMTLPILREAKASLASILAHYDEVVTTVAPADEPSMRFARHLGFEPHGAPEPVGDGFVVRLEYPREAA